MLVDCVHQHTHSARAEGPPLTGSLVHGMQSCSSGQAWAASALRRPLAHEQLLCIGLHSNGVQRRWLGQAAARGSMCNISDIKVSWVSPSHEMPLSKVQQVCMSLTCLRELPSLLTIVSMLPIGRLSPSKETAKCYKRLACLLKLPALPCWAPAATLVGSSRLKAATSC